MRPRRTRVVPRLVLGASFIGVLPACALEACGGQTTAKDGGSDAAEDTFLGVFACCFEAGVVAIGFDADADAPTEASEASDDGAPSDGPEGG